MGDIPKKNPGGRDHSNLCTLLLFPFNFIALLQDKIGRWVSRVEELGEQIMARQRRAVLDSVSMIRPCLNVRGCRTSLSEALELCQTVIIHSDAFEHLYPTSYNLM